MMYSSLVWRGSPSRSRTGGGTSLLLWVVVGRKMGLSVVDDREKETRGNKERVVEKRGNSK